MLINKDNQIIESIHYFICIVSIFDLLYRLVPSPLPPWPRDLVTPWPPDLLTPSHTHTYTFPIPLLFNSSYTPPHPDQFRFIRGVLNPGLMWMISIILGMDPWTGPTDRTTGKREGQHLTMTLLFLFLSPSSLFRGGFLFRGDWLTGAGD